MEKHMNQSSISINGSQILINDWYGVSWGQKWVGMHGGEKEIYSNSTQIANLLVDIYGNAGFDYWGGFARSQNLYWDGQQIRLCAYWSRHPWEWQGWKSMRICRHE